MKCKQCGLLHGRGMTCENAVNRAMNYYQSVSRAMTRKPSDAPADEMKIRELSKTAKLLGIRFN